MVWYIEPLKSIQIQREKRTNIALINRPADPSGVLCESHKFVWLPIAGRMSRRKPIDKSWNMPDQASALQMKHALGRYKCSRVLRKKLRWKVLHAFPLTKLRPRHKKINCPMPTTPLEEENTKIFMHYASHKSAGPPTQTRSLVIWELSATKEVAIKDVKVLEITTEHSTPHRIRAPFTFPFDVLFLWHNEATEVRQKRKENLM